MRTSAPAWVLAAISAALFIPITGSAFADASKGAPAGAHGGAGGASGKPADAKPNLTPGGGGGPKILHTIPLDGGGSEEIPASSRLVRDVVAVHPHEDLVICIAGCKPGQDRVVYAQPADPQARPAPVPVAETAPAAVPSADTANAAGAGSEKSEPAKDQDSTNGAKADSAAPSSAPEPAAKPEMVPTSSEAPAAPAPEADAASQPPRSDVDDVQKRLRFDPKTGKVIEGEGK